MTSVLAEWTASARTRLGWTKRAPKKLVDAIWLVLASFPVGAPVRAEIVLHAAALLLEESLGDEPAPDYRDSGLTVDEAVGAYAFAIANVCAPAKGVEDAELFLQQAFAARQARQRSQSHDPDFNPVASGVRFAAGQLSPQVLPPARVPEQAVQAQPVAQDTGVAPAQSRRQGRCTGCGLAASRCVCVPPPSGPRNRQPPPPPPPPPAPKGARRQPHEDTDDDTEDDTDDDQDEDTDDDNTDEEVDTLGLCEGPKVDLEDPGVFLSPKGWATASRQHGALELFRAVENFYAAETRTRQHEAKVILDIVLLVCRALGADDPATVTKHLVSIGSRALSRLEFFASHKRLGALGAATVEQELVERNLPEELRRARRRGEKRAETDAKLQRSKARPSQQPRGKKSGAKPSAKRGGNSAPTGGF
jgi:hypothetical protein